MLVGSFRKSYIEQAVGGEWGVKDVKDVTGRTEELKTSLSCRFVEETYF